MAMVLHSTARPPKERQTTKYRLGRDPRRPGANAERKCVCVCACVRVCVCMHACVCV